MYLDEKGLIVDSDGDAGDQLQREGFWAEGMFFNPSPVAPNMIPYIPALRNLVVSNGYVRSWKPPYNNPSDTSRDQLVSNIRACGYLKIFTVVKFIFWNVVKNYSRFPNGDLAFINDYGRFIRALNLWILWPLLFIFDLPILVNSFIICFWLARTPSKWQVWLASKYSWLYWLTNQYPPNAEGAPQNPYGPYNTSNDINHIGDLAQAKEVLATPISWLARLVYKSFRPGGISFALDSYFAPGTKANPEFATLWIPIVRKF